MKIYKTWIICALALSFYAWGAVENPVAAAAEQDAEAANKKWEEFSQVLTWYIAREKPETLTASNEDEEFLAEILNDKWSEEYAKFKETILELNEEFLQFRKHLAEALSQRASGVTSAAIEMEAAKEATDWYVKVMEKYLLPSSWKNEYTTQLEKEKK